MTYSNIERLIFVKSYAMVWGPRLDRSKIKIRFVWHVGVQGQVRFSFHVLRPNFNYKHLSFRECDGRSIPNE